MILPRPARVRERPCVLPVVFDQQDPHRTTSPCEPRSRRTGKRIVKICLRWLPLHMLPDDFDNLAAAMEKAAAR